MQINKNILLVNPWIADFAAYDLWSKPLGLLAVGGFLEDYGYNISLIDLQNREYWGMEQKQGKYAQTGRGKYHKTIISKPDPVQDISRHYGLYGATRQQFTNELEARSPDAILVTSQMTYWYPGVQKTVDILKDEFPNVPLIQGGIYVTLCPEHAHQQINADYFIKGAGEKRGLELLDGIFGINRNYSNISELVSSRLPWHLYDELDSVSILSSRGCPYNCDFCATKTLQPKFFMREPADIINEIKYIYNNFDLNNIAFYDDALFFNKEEHIKPILRRLGQMELDINFHTPNGLFTSEIDQELAELMYKNQFTTVRLSLESSVTKWLDSASNKVTKHDFQRAIQHLKEAGYNSTDIETYLIMGLPGQTVQEVKDSLDFVYQSGAISRLAAFTPIPTTEEWNRAVDMGLIEEDIDPVLTNNTLHPCANEDFPEREYQNLRDYSNKLNNKIRNKDG